MLGDFSVQEHGEKTVASKVTEQAEGLAHYCTRDGFC
jgi:hypothetical protein